MVLFLSLPVPFNLEKDFLVEFRMRCLKMKSVSNSGGKGLFTSRNLENRTTLLYIYLSPTHLESLSNVVLQICISNSPRHHMQKFRQINLAAFVSIHSISQILQFSICKANISIPRLRFKTF